MKKFARVLLHDGTEATAEVLVANEHGATLRIPFADGFVTIEVVADGQAWGSEVHVVHEDVVKLRVGKKME